MSDPSTLHRLPTRPRGPRASAALAAVLVLLVVPASVLGAAQIVLDDLPWPPYFLENGEGYVQEIFDRCLPRLGHEPRYESLPIPRMWSALTDGELDLHVMSHTPERERNVVYGENPVFTATYRPVVRAGSPIVIDGVEDFRGLQLGHLRGLRHSGPFQDLLEEREKGEDLEIAGSDEALLRMLAAGRIDVTVGMTSALRWTAGRIGLADQIEVLPWIARQGSYHFVVSRASRRIVEPERFLAELDGCVAELRAEGTLDELRERLSIE